MSRIIVVFLVVGLLIGCESTGRHVSSATSEEATLAEVVPPVVVEEAVVEPVVEEIEDNSFTEESVVQEIESSEDVPEEVNTEQAGQEIKESGVTSSTPNKVPPPPNPHAPVSVAPPHADAAELIQPKRLQDVYFDFDQAVILDRDKTVLEANSSLLTGHFKHLNVLIEGHCDERGSVEYNLVLGVRRAQVVKAYFIDLGISPSRIRIVSYGKERPVCTEQHDACWKKNRRVHFVLQ